MVVIYLLLLFGVAIIWTIWGLRSYGRGAQKSPKSTKKEGSIVFLRDKVKHYGDTKQKTLNPKPHTSTNTPSTRSDT